MEKKYAIGVDIGGTNIKIALVDSNGDILEKDKKPTGHEPVDVLFGLLDKFYLPYSAEVVGIAIGAAGIIERAEGIILYSPNIPKLTSLRLKELIQDRYKTCVILENDANAAAYGEKFIGSGKSYKSFVILTLGTGIGGGVVIDNELLPVATEIGHMTINSDGNPCPCGNTGCLESYASATAIVSSAISQIEKGAESNLKALYNGNFYKITSEDIYKAALEGDSLSRMVLKEAGKNLGVGIANVINIFSPDAVILTGGLSGASSIYIDSAISEASKRAIKELYKRTNIVISKADDNAGVVGAALLAFEGCKVLP